MFTKHSETFIAVAKRLENNIATGNLKESWFVRSDDVDKLISQVIFETLSYLEDKQRPVHKSIK